MSRVTKHVVAIVGGAVSGSETARGLAQGGAPVVVFEKHARPYGKIEDGLPRWHAEQRKLEYSRIDARLKTPGIHYVPLTTLGEDVQLDELLAEWGFSLVLLAHGAQRDRAFPVDGWERFEGKGLILQNPLVYWFNHYKEAAYDGPRYELPDETVVFGGGLASIDVVKILMLVTVGRELEKRGLPFDMHQAEQKGIPWALEQHGLAFEELGLEGCLLYYRRRKSDMPLVELPAGLDDKRKQKIEMLRGRLLEKAMKKFCFRYQERTMAKEILADGDRLVGLRCVRTEVVAGRAKAIPGSEFEARAPLVISSLGSIPDPIEGIDRRGDRYLYVDENAPAPALKGRPDVIAVGNVVTGKGNIRASRKHGAGVAAAVLEQLETLEPHPAERIGALLERVATRQRQVGYDGDYDAWIQRVTPPDLE